MLELQQLPNLVGNNSDLGHFQFVWPRVHCSVGCRQNCDNSHPEVVRTGWISRRKVV